VGKAHLCGRKSIEHYMDMDEYIRIIKKEERLKKRFKKSIKRMKY